MGKISPAGKTSRRRPAGDRELGLGHSRKWGCTLSAGAGWRRHHLPCKPRDGAGGWAREPCRKA